MKLSFLFAVFLLCSNSWALDFYLLTGDSNCPQKLGIEKSSGFVTLASVGPNILNKSEDGDFTVVGSSHTLVAALGSSQQDGPWRTTAVDQAGRVIITRSQVNNGKLVYSESSLLEQTGNRLRYTHEISAWGEDEPYKIQCLLEPH